MNSDFPLRRVWPRPLQQMKTYKQQLYRRWWRGNFIAGVSLFALILFLVFSGKFEYTVLLIPIIFVSSFIGSLKCPNCNKRLNIPSGSWGFLAVNHCSACAFDLNQQAPKDNQNKKEN